MRTANFLTSVNGKSATNDRQHRIRMNGTAATSAGALGWLVEAGRARRFIVIAAFDSGRCGARCNAAGSESSEAFRNASKVSARRRSPFRPCEIILVERAQVRMRAAACYL